MLRVSCEKSLDKSDTEHIEVFYVEYNTVIPHYSFWLRNKNIPRIPYVTIIIKYQLQLLSPLGPIFNKHAALHVSSHSCVNITLLISANSFLTLPPSLSFSTYNDAAFTLLLNIMFKYKYVFLSIASSVIKLSKVGNKYFHFHNKC
jgi:hypothetical protein